eukprot:12174693-Karenia_brevis.AAC.1
MPLMVENDALAGVAGKSPGTPQAEDDVELLGSSPAFTPPPSESTFTRLVRRPEDIPVGSESGCKDSGAGDTSSG